VGARCADAAALEVEDAVGESDRRQPVRDDDQGRVELVSQTPQDLRLDRRIDGARRVVEDEQPRLPDERTSQRDALPFTARERVPPLPHDRVVTARQILDERGRPRDPRRPPDLLRRGPGVERDVLAHRAGKQEALLEHDRRGPAQRGGVRVSQVHATDDDLAGRRVVEAYEQLRERRLADAGSTDEGDRLVRPNLERHLLEHGDAVERVPDGLRPNRQRPVGKHDRACGALDRDGLFEDARDAAVADDGAG
jgi:hypothetical protein